jgi:hypothetical protein
MGHTLSTSREMNTWKNWFEIRIEKESIDCINATEGGLLISGARRLCLQEAVMSFAGRKADIDGIISGSLSTRIPADRESIEKSLEKLVKVARQVKKLCSLGIKEAEKLRETAQKKQNENAVSNINAACAGYIRAVMKESEFIGIIHWRLESTLDKIQRLQSGIKPSDAGKRAFLNAQTHMMFFREVYRVSREFEKNVRSLNSKKQRTSSVTVKNVC